MSDQEPRLRDRGDRVAYVQALLNRHGAGLAQDGAFGPMTDRALRSYQRRHDLFPADGIAGPRTMASLEGTQAPREHVPTAAQASAPRALAVAHPDLVAPARAAASMTLSRDGAFFIERHEEQRGVTDTVHHPPGASGVTIGPGYDMRDRSRADIQDDLVAVGVPSDIAARLAEGSGLTGRRASEFVHRDRGLVHLTDDQQAALLQEIVGAYEEMVGRTITIPLHQYEFDALVSFAYNPGGGWHAVTRAVNEHHYDRAMDALRQQDHSGGRHFQGLANRRRDESYLFLYGVYR